MLKAALLIALFAPQDSATLERAKKTIRARDLQRHAYRLSGQMKGRSSARAGELIVARYVAALFKRYKLKPAGEKRSYVQSFPVNTRGVKGTGYNVFGYVEGSDPKLKDEFIVIGAHMDAVGGRGADDNASGTATVLELAEAIGKMRKKPKRSILFCAWGSEELWMVGSYYFVKNTTIIPLSKMKVYINLDMVGRNDGTTRQVWIAGADSAEPSIKPIIDKHSKDAKIKVGIEDPKISPPGDVMPFYENGIPFLYFYTWSYEKLHPDYHKPSDKPEKLHYPSMEKIARLTFHILVDLANDKVARTKVDGFRFPHPLQGKKR